MTSLRTRILAVAERRLPALTRLRHAEKLPIHLDRRRIYVVPTRFGLAFSGLLFVMLLGALNYSNNPALLLTCLLSAATGASVFFGFRTVSGLALIQLRADETHAGDTLRMHLKFAPGTRTRPSLRIRREDANLSFALPPGGDREIVLNVPDVRRGWFRPGRLRLWTDYPLGLFQLWSWLNPETRFLVYPTLETPAPPLPSSDGCEGDYARAGAREEDAGLRDYRPTDATRLIAWKASARHDTLLVHDVERHAGAALTLDYARLGSLDHEARIRRLSAWVIAAEVAQHTYLLRLPHADIGPGLGGEQRRACLRALALLP